MQLLGHIKLFMGLKNAFKPRCWAHTQHTFLARVSYSSLAVRHVPSLSGRVLDFEPNNMAKCSWAKQLL